RLVRRRVQGLRHPLLHRRPARAPARRVGRGADQALHATAHHLQGQVLHARRRPLRAEGSTEAASADPGGRHGTEARAAGGGGVRTDVALLGARGGRGEGEGGVRGVRQDLPRGGGGSGGGGEGALAGGGGARGVGGGEAGEGARARRHRRTPHRRAAVTAV